jgi:hypothetical protein
MASPTNERVGNKKAGNQEAYIKLFSWFPAFLGVQAGLGQR